MKFGWLFVGLVLAMMAVGRAQNASQSASGPVQLPPGVATNAPAFFQYPLPSATPAPTQAQPGPALTAPPLAVPATTPTDTTTGDIHDIRGPMAIPYQWLWAAYIVAGLAAIAALYGLWRFFRSRLKAKAKLPHEIALERLEAARALLAPESIREYAFTVSEIIRVYIEQCFAEKAAHRTTEEFLSDLVNRAASPLATHRRRLEDFLSHCDLIKFAKWDASTRELESMHESARVFIVETQPKPETVKPAEPSTLPPVPVQPELSSAK